MPTGSDRADGGGDADLGEGDPNLAQMLQPHFVLMDWLAIDGSEAQRRRYYGDVMKGAIISNAFAERAGKTPGDFRSLLSRHGAGYRLNGTKFYATGSMIADQLYVLCRLEDGAHVVAIMPANRHGIEIIDDWDGMGQRTTGSGTRRPQRQAVAYARPMSSPSLKRRPPVPAAARRASAAPP